MIKLCVGIATFTLAGVLAGCQTHAGHPAQPARLVERSAQTQQELQVAINARLPGTTVIAEDLFAMQSVALFDVNHDPAQSGSAVLPQPVRIRLIKRGQSCLLQFADGEEVLLQHARCEPAGGEI